MLRGHRTLMDAYLTDVRPLQRELCESHGRPADPIAAHRDSGYAGTVAAERGTASEGGSGYPT